MKLRELRKRFREDSRFRQRLQKEMVAAGITEAEGLDPDKIDRWLALIFKYLPMVLKIIAMF